MQVNKKIVVLVIGLAVLAGIFWWINQNNKQSSVPNQNQINPQSNQDESAEIISTKPDPLDNATISSDEIIEITFNKSLSFTGEFKHRLEPEIEYSLELSEDKRTVKIIPDKPFELGYEYTLIILGDTKFEDGSKLSEEKIYHFKTVKFRGF
ncbi:hypothetical protein HYS94_03355 [Candidatus Daviesbacteria bacterium]|nr:hypothetical protein [Candidatus Daviesbacteria bacterium]